MKQTSHENGGAWGSRLMIAAALLATVFVGLFASTPATAQSELTDPLTGCPTYLAPECAHTQGFDTANPSANPSASPSASATASPSPSPTPTATPTTTPTASPTASAAQDQYQERPDTDGKAVAPAETTEAKQLPNTGPGTDGKGAGPAGTTEATGLPETDRNSSVLPLVLGSGVLLVGGSLLARRLIR